MGYLEISMKKKRNVRKEPSLLRKIIEIHFEQMRRRRELRRLQKQEWSYDFLSYLLINSAKLSGQNCILEIVNKDNMRIRLTIDSAKDAYAKLDDKDIFNHLDDDAAIDDFINKHSMR